MPPERHDDALRIFGQREPWFKVIIALRRTPPFGLADDVKPILIKRTSRTSANAYWLRAWRIIRRGKPSPWVLYRAAGGKWTASARPQVCIDDPTAPQAAYSPAERRAPKR